MFVLRGATNPPADEDEEPHAASSSGSRSPRGGPSAGDGRHRPGTFNIVPAGPSGARRRRPRCSSRGRGVGLFRDGDDERAGECLYPGDFAGFKLARRSCSRAPATRPTSKPLPECPVRFSVGAGQDPARRRPPRVEGQPPRPAPPSRSLHADAHRLRPCLWRARATPRTPSGRRRARRAARTSSAPARSIRSAAIARRPPASGRLTLLAGAERQAGKEYGEAYGSARALLRRRFRLVATSTRRPPISSSRVPARRRGAGVPEPPPEHPGPLDAPPGAANPRLRQGRPRRASARCAMNLDTLFADLDEETVTLTWRGLTPVRGRSRRRADGAPRLGALGERAAPRGALPGAPRGLRAGSARRRDRMPSRSERRRSVRLRRRPGARRAAGRALPGRTRSRPCSGARWAGRPEQARVREAISRMMARRAAGRRPPTRAIAKAVCGAARPRRGALVPSQGAPPCATRASASSSRSMRDTVERLKRDAAAGAARIGGLDACEALQPDPRLRARWRPRGRRESAPGGAGPRAEPVRTDFSGENSRGRGRRAPTWRKPSAEADLRGCNLAERPPEARCPPPRPISAPTYRPPT